jgi:RHS repeat-associated protein
VDNRVLRGGLVMTLTALSGAALTASVASPRPRSLSAQQVPSIHGTWVAPPPRPDDRPPAPSSFRPVPVHWPSGAGEADLAASVSPVQVGSLPVRVGRLPGSDLSRVRVSVLDRAGLSAVWQNGVVLAVDGVAGAGEASVAVSYRDFAGAVGGDWASRLRVVQVPECGLSTPDTTGCQPTALASSNTPAAAEVSANVTVLGRRTTMLAVTSGPSGSAGDFTVSTLQASATWTAGGNSGSFAWNYPMRTPPSLGGPSPKVALAYSSAAVDGRSQATNNQPSWIGEGFDWWPGSIERRYKPCASDGGSTGDLCWGTDNAILSLSGSGGELVKDDATGTWRLRNDDNSRVEHVTGAANGDDNGEYWRVTIGDGTQFYFGLNQLPGYTGTTPADKTTSSVWTLPVAGNNSGEPCHGATFVASFCTQAWRWNLDYVVDPHGNTMSLYYNQQTNLYGRNDTATDVVSYVRGGTLDHVDYGTDNRSGTDTVNTATPAPMRVVFAADDRCLTSCGDHANWPDTPWDQDCAASPCTGRFSPTFWTTKRLSGVTTRVWGGSAYKDVEAWTLTHTFPDPGDGTRAGLWLASIAHAGSATGPAVIGGSVTLPDVTFEPVQMPNRVDTVGDGKFPMNWMRMSTIRTETGAKVDIRYSGADCIPGTRMPASPPTNTLRCYPVLEEQPDHSIKTEYFHKYVVTSVTEADVSDTQHGASPDVVTSYEYVGAPAWRRTDDDGLTQDILRTWSDYRGYAQVNTRVGDSAAGNQSLSEATYFRGMNGDLDGAGGTRGVSVAAVDGNGDGDTVDTADAPAVPDENAYAGTVRQSTVFNGVESAPVATTVSQPWQSAPTSSRVTGATTAYARHTATAVTWQSTVLAAGARRVSRVDTTLDAYGMPTKIDDQGDVAVSIDDQCTKTTYNRNTGANIVELAGRVEVYGLRCSASPSSEADVLSDTRSSFDGQAYGSPPSKGERTRVEVAKSWASPGGSVWLTQSTTVFDAYGRPADVTDVRGNHTTTTYTPSSGPFTSVAITTALGQTTTTYEPAWSIPTATVDINNKRTEATYDALGRTRQVWLANHLKASFPSAPNTSYTYLVRKGTGVNAVTTAKLNAATTSTNAYYTTTYALYDGFLRPRQAQTPSAATGNVGTVFANTTYDALGRVATKSQHFDSTVQPSTTLAPISDWQPLTQTMTLYDRANRETDSLFRSSGTENWRTTTSYGGDRVNVTHSPTAGFTATTTLSDARGRTTQLRQYHNPADLGSDTRSLYDAVTYHYDRKGHQDSVTDNAGNTWTAGFDLLGRQKTAHDPDKGDAAMAFNDAGDALTTTDGRGQTLAYTYDTLGRKTGEYNGSVAPANKLATWLYDAPGFKGQLSSSSRWLNSGVDEYKVKVRAYTPLYQPTGEDYTIPASLTGLSGTYTISRSYTVDGNPATLGYPAAGGLNAETVTYTYDQVTGLPEQLQTNSGVGQYVANTDYTAYGELSFLQYQLLAGAYLQRLFVFDNATHQLKQATTIRENSPQAVDNLTYAYDNAGNVTAITSNGTGGAADNQCFGYDYARRLTDAWTPSSGDCAAAKSASALGGPAPYWHSWTFDTAGNRATQTVHTVGGNTATTLGYPTPGSAQPHAATSATTGSTTQAYRYDSGGNTTCRPSGPAANTCPSGADSQTLSWDPERHLSTVSDGSGTSAYTYTADGVRLVADDPTATTLYLSGTEIRRTKATGALTPTRYFHWAGQVCAMKTTGGAVTWLITDHHGTQAVAVAAGNQTITTRRQYPYGGTRGTASSWPNPQGFVGGTNDPTGIVHIGARDYDAALGRFISADPVFDEKDPQSWTGYAYADHTPATASDPTGLILCGDDGCNQRAIPVSGGGYKVVGTPQSSTPPCAPNCQPNNPQPGPTTTPTHTNTSPTAPPVAHSGSSGQGPTADPNPSSYWGGGGQELAERCKRADDGTYNCASAYGTGASTAGSCSVGEASGGIGVGIAYCHVWDTLGNEAMLKVTVALGDEYGTLGASVVAGAMSADGSIEDQGGEFQFVTVSWGEGISGAVTFAWGTGNACHCAVGSMFVGGGVGIGGGIIYGRSCTEIAWINRPNAPGPEVHCQ